MSAEATKRFLATYQMKKDFEAVYEGETVLWRDEHGNSVGPGTVVGVFNAGTPFVEDYVWKLSIVEHATELYVSHFPDEVEVIDFTEDQWDNLEGRLRDEIMFAQAYGTQCGLNSEDATIYHAPERCEADREYGEEQCGRHH